jgi:hypothetical protein
MKHSINQIQIMNLHCIDDEQAEYRIEFWMQTKRRDFNVPLQTPHLRNAGGTFSIGVEGILN